MTRIASQQYQRSSVPGVTWEPRRRRNVFSGVCLAVKLFVCLQDYKKSTKLNHIKLSEEVGHQQKNTTFQCKFRSFFREIALCLSSLCLLPQFQNQRPQFILNPHKRKAISVVDGTQIYDMLHVWSWVMQPSLLLNWCSAWCSASPQMTPTKKIAVKEMSENPERK